MSTAGGVTSSSRNSDRTGGGGGSSAWLLLPPSGRWRFSSFVTGPVSRIACFGIGPVSTAEEYQNDMNLPHLFGTRRVGPDLIREAGKHSSDWQMAHLYDPRSVSPYSVMPSYPWFFDDQRRPTRRALALVAYLQWLGSWIPESERVGGP